MFIHLVSFFRNRMVARYDTDFDQELDSVHYFTGLLNAQSMRSYVFLLFARQI